ncbi:MAG: chromate transporter [Burkholderiaceae bacterium]
MNFETMILIAQTFAMTAIVSIGGIATMIPEIHRIAVETYAWMDDTDFATAFAISQVAPGPNVLLMSLVGWRVAGFAGLMTATLSTVLPTAALSVGFSRLESKLKTTPWYAIINKSFPPLIVGLMLSSGLVTAKASIHSAFGIMIAIGVALYSYHKKTNPLYPIFASVLIGILAGRLGYL